MSDELSNSALDYFMRKLTRTEVEAAVAECEREGTSGFLKAHGFGLPRRWVLMDEGRQYPAKAIAAVALSYLLDGPKLTARTFYNGFGEDRAFSRLKELGYEISQPEVSASGAIDREAILAAMDDCDKLGLEDFLEKNAFGMPRDYWVLRPGSTARYPAKAIVGVAHGHVQGGAVLKNADFNGGNGPGGANSILRQHGFEIVGTDCDPDTDESIADKIRRFLIEEYVRPAIGRQAAEFEVVSGDVHREMGE
ncbi:hypothetical protein [Novosphingobium sp. PC22D]|uniref:hypothetical protein n=1 Tax=Novosphingobium sp. PC22D TaxID=1962403 RepID=UPI001145BDEA|nr:hypothetical protein [Novosphingobium sp. PC22D]